MIRMVVVPKMVQIRDVPDEVHRELRARAGRSGLSLSEYLLRELETLVSRRAFDELFNEWRGPRARLANDEVTEAIRRDREAR